MVAVFTVGVLLVFVWLVGVFLTSLSGDGQAHRRAVERRQADVLARAIQTKQALDAEAFATHRRMVAHAVQQQRQSRR